MRNQHYLNVENQVDYLTVFDTVVGFHSYQLLSTQLLD
jgi:hypothetical protein